jgi:hypothetical protein
MMQSRESTPPAVAAFLAPSQAIRMTIPRSSTEAADTYPVIRFYGSVPSSASEVKWADIGAVGMLFFIVTDSKRLYAGVMRTSLGNLLLNANVEKDNLYLASFVHKSNDSAKAATITLHAHHDTLKIEMEAFELPIHLAASIAPSSTITDDEPTST